MKIERKEIGLKDCFINYQDRMNKDLEFVGCILFILFIAFFVKFIIELFKVLFL